MGGDDLGLHQTVGGETKRPAGQSLSSAQREPGDPDRGARAGGDGPPWRPNAADSAHIWAPAPPATAPPRPPPPTPPRGPRAPTGALGAPDEPAEPYAHNP